MIPSASLLNPGGSGRAAAARRAGRSAGGGTEVRLRGDGYQLGTYTMLVGAPGVPVRVPARCTNTCCLEADGTLVDTIELASLGMRVGRQVMRLKPVDTRPSPPQ